MSPLSLLNITQAAWVWFGLTVVATGGALWLVVENAREPIELEDRARGWHARSGHYHAHLANAMSVAV